MWPSEPVPSQITSSTPSGFTPIALGYLPAYAAVPYSPMSTSMSSRTQATLCVL